MAKNQYYIRIIQKFNLILNKLKLQRRLKRYAYSVIFY